MNPGTFWDLAGRGLSQIMISFSYNTPGDIVEAAPVMSILQHFGLPMEGNILGT